MANSTEQRNQITKEIMDRLEAICGPEFDEIYFTGDNTNTISFMTGKVNDEPVYGSIKFTLHKSNWNLDDEIEKYFAKVEERELKEKNRRAAKEKKERELALKREKAAKRAEAAELEKKRTQKSIAELKEQLKSYESESVEEVE